MASGGGPPGLPLPPVWEDVYLPKSLGLWGPPQPGGSSVVGGRGRKRTPLTKCVQMRWGPVPRGDLHLQPGWSPSARPTPSSQAPACPRPTVSSHHSSLLGTNQTSTPWIPLSPPLGDPQGPRNWG